jgi:uncharacterized protein YycO
MAKDTQSTKIAQAAEEALKVIANAAAEALKVTNLATGSDHDTITKLVEAVSNIDKKFTDKFLEVREDIKKISDGTSKQIDDHEVRINSLETSKTKQNTTMAIGIGILSLLVTLLIWHLTGK